ncbi:uncharacterized protein BJX67DRAFT_8493 [Aspergillus lucknowensis]|uniref:Aminoglycoside phosphotransferase domain-containing protein n=1 Tax=Aspergillus lucknowensis TaxID=176173 RepID=A0ABR4M770_9EURO
MTDGRTVLARIPYRNTGPASLATASKVATLTFLRDILGLPVPKVLAWNAAVDGTNSVGAEYMIMELPQGKNLANIPPSGWGVQTVKDLVELQRKLLSVKFLGYGCLFFSKDAPPGSCPVTIYGNQLSSEVKRKVAKQYSVGPMVTPEYWKNERAQMNIDRGPWISPLKYLEAPARRELSWISQYAASRPVNLSSFFWRKKFPPADHVDLIKRYLRVAPYLLPKDESLMGSYLWHTDFRSANMYVDDHGCITGITDLSETWARPLYLGRRVPRLMEAVSEGDFIREIFEASAQDEHTARRDQSRIGSTYFKLMAESSLLFRRMVEEPYLSIREGPFHHVGNTWDTDLMRLLAALADIQKNWKALNHKASCPLRFSNPMLRRIVEKQKDRLETERYWDDVSKILTRDGWTRHETYNKAQGLHEKARSPGVWAAISSFISSRWRQIWR